ncbi:transcription factor bHLH [Quillaja saponaria]|uniref:Transcription factor bHLH n=1 Tax=Quillaja saponaria TaxID=32244 RepID=A0AAD7PCM5_QUISA|nr:transcription factor bHLH [Quillaja saponaria]
MDIDNPSKPKAEGKLLVVILVGAPGSGKSTFCEHVMRSSTRPWVRICQDTIGNGKAGNKTQCLSSAARALKDGKSVFIDRCNLDREQRSEFVKLGGPQIDVHAVVLDLPARLCISRSVKRTGHEGNLQGGKAAAVVNRMLQKKELPKISEGFNRIMFCQNENDVQSAISTYSTLGPLDNLPDGCFGQKNPDAKIQVGIMKFLKKVDVPVNVASRENSIRESVSPQIVEKKNSCCREEEEEACSSIPVNAGFESKEAKDLDGTPHDAPTLAFPSISTSDFQFNHEKAADIIVETVEEFTNKIGNARLVLVDLTHGSKILSLVRAKAAQKNIDSQKFFTHVGDITHLYSKGGLHCNVIANAANWRLKPGGGGVNAAIFSEAGVTHVIHVLGPNMNPQRANCLNNDYNEGCKILREAYTSLFDGFASIVWTGAEQSKGSSEDIGSKALELCQSNGCTRKHSSNSDQKIKRDGIHASERSKRCKGPQDDFGANSTNSRAGKLSPENRNIDGSMSKAWGSWAQALHRIAIHPERHEDDVLEISEDVVVLNDLYPKAQRHLLVLARTEGLDSLANVRKEHLQLLKKMHAVGLLWAEKFLRADGSLVFRLGYHSVPSMRQLHLHVISQDFDSKHSKNKKHWNSFNTGFFRDSVDVIDEVTNHGKATLKDDDRLLNMELRCHRCRSAHPNIPRLKSHITICQAPFPAVLLENGRLVHAPQ